MNMSRGRRFLLCLLTLCASTAYGQQHANVERGFAADKVYQFGNIDSVNVYNGNVTISIPIGLRYPNNGGMTYGLTLSYNSKLWNYDQGYCQPDQGMGCNIVRGADGIDREVSNTYSRSVPSRRSNAGFGWLISLGRLIDPLDTGSASETDQDISISGFPRWIYESPDGNDHEWWAWQGTGGGMPIDPNVAYTTDGSNLRMRTITATKREIDYPDGSIHTFEKITLDFETRYRITRMQDAFGNTVTISYPNSLTWVLTDQFNRVQWVYFRQISNAQKNYRKILDRVVLTSFNGTTATWQFNYNAATNINLVRPGASGLGIDTIVPTLTSVELPDGVTAGTGSTFSFQYYDLAFFAGVRGQIHSGAIRSLTLPTKGRIDYQYTTYRVPGGQCDQIFLNATAGLSTRTFTGINGETPAAWTSAPSLQPGVCATTCPLPDPNGVTPADRPGPLDDPRKELIVTVTAPDKNKTKHYFSVYPQDIALSGPSCGNFTGWEFGLPFSKDRPVSRAPNFPDTVWRSSETFDCAGLDSCPDASATPARPKRSSYLNYESATEDFNWRPAGQRTVFHDDGDQYIDSISTSFDGYGNYRSERVGGTFGSEQPTGTFGSERLTVTNYNPASINSVGRISTTGPMAIPPTAKWILGKYDSVTTTERSVTQKSAFCFDTDGFLKGRRVMKGLSPVTDDVLTIFTPEVIGVRTGNVAAEEWFGGDAGPWPSAPLDTCQFATGGRYRINYTYQYGVPATSQYSGVSFKSLDLTIDSATGLARSSRDTAGIQTDYEYDKLGRITWLKPTGQAWSEYEYKKAGEAPGYLTAAVNVRQRPNGSPTGSPLAESKFVFDSFGRVWRELTLIDSAWAMRDTTLNAMGQKWKVSEQIPEQAARPTTKITTLENYDPFGRAWKVTAADGSVTDFTFKGERERERIQRSIRGLTANIDALTKETYDHHGRLTTVTETEPTTITTTYAYDVANRLISVNMQGQPRTFLYDNRGFLLEETHPELRVNPDLASTGKIAYGSYDAKGHPGTKTLPSAPLPSVDPPPAYNYATFDLKYEYDSAERLMRVWSRNPLRYCTTGCSTNTEFRLFKQFLFGEGAVAGDRSRGKVIKAIRQNYQDTWGDLVVKETFAYGETENLPLAQNPEKAGRLTSKETEVGQYMGTYITQCPVPNPCPRPNDIVLQQPSSAIQSFRESFSYTDLGDYQNITYPTCITVGCGEATSPVVTSGYQNGRLKSVTGYANPINYHPSGMISSITHSNGVVMTQEADLSGMARPRSISTANVIACELPVITSQPPNTVLIAPNTSTRLTVVATGSGVLSYQWYEGEVGDVGISLGGNVDYLDTPQSSQTKRYWVWIKNTCGSTSGKISLAGGADQPMAEGDTVSAVFSNKATVRVGSFTATPNPIEVCDGTGLGITTLNWSFPEAANVEIRVGSPTGTLFAASGSSGSGATGKWVTNGMVFYAQDVSGGKPLTAANTLATLAATVRCTQPYAASFVSQSVPATMLAGQTYAVSVTMKNNGTNIWSAAGNYKLGSQNAQDNVRWGMSRLLIPAGVSVAQGAQITFSFNVTAPAAAGTHNFQWQMVHEFVQWFGSLTPNVAIVVSGSTPTNLVATASSATNVSLSWTAVGGASSYEVERRNGAGLFTRIGTPTAASHVDSTATAGIAYLYRVRAMTGGSPSAYSNLDVATTLMFTDPTITAAATLVKGVHLTELRTAVNAVRATAGLAAAVWTDPSPANVLIKAIHVSELRTRINEACTALGLAAPGFTDPTITATTTIVKKVHIDELRQRVQ